jgi:hypothetical protein
MENQEFLKLYLHPLTTIMDEKKDSKQTEYKSYIQLITEFNKAYSSLPSEEFQRKVIDTYKNDITAAMHYSIGQNRKYTQAIHGYISFFFWLSIVSVAVAVIALFVSVN